MIQLIAGAAGGGLVVGALLSAWAVGTYKDAIWENSVNDSKIAAQTVLIEETDKVIKLERAAQARVRELEAQHAQEEKNLDVIQRRNRALAAELGGLRDPGRRQSGSGPMPLVATSAHSPTNASDPALLSAEATSVLLSAAAEVDALANYARTCYDYVQSVGTAYEKHQPRQPD